MAISASKQPSGIEPRAPARFIRRVPGMCVWAHGSPRRLAPPKAGLAEVLMAISNGAFRVSPQLKRWMKSKHLDQRRLAEELKLSDSLVSCWFTQKPCKHPSWQTLKKLCLMTGLKVGELLVFDPHGKQYKKPACRQAGLPLPSAGLVRLKKSSVLALLIAALCLAMSGGIAFAADVQLQLDDTAGSAALSIQDSALTEKARINSLGNLGLGTTTPQDKLIVLGGNVGIGTWTASNSLIVRQGNVGIGTAIVPQSLYVAGTAEAQAFKLNQNPVAGYVLTSNSVGVGTWMAAGTLASGSVASGTINQVAKYAATGPSVSGSSILFDDATNVGVGTSTPQSAFVVTNGNVGIGTWTATNSLIVRQGNVGIGTSTVPQSLYVAGTAEAQGFKLNQNPSAGYVLTSNSVGVGTWMAAGTLSSGSVNSGTINQVAKYAATGAVVSGSSILFDDATNVGIGTAVPLSLLDVNRKFNVLSGGNIGIGTFTPQGAFTVTNGNVGIGTWAPTAALAIGANALTVTAAGAISASTGIITSGGYTQSGTSANTFTGTPTFSNATNSALFTGGNIGVGTITPQDAFVVTNGNVGIGTWSASNSLIVRQGNVGIGTATVPQSLYVAGTAEAQAFKLNQNASAGYVLTSTSVGVGTWMPASTLASGSVNSGTINRFAIYASTGTVVSDQTILYSDATNVGIGTAGPSTLFDVNRKFNVLSGGNVGIGSINPGQPLDIAGNIRSRGTNSHFFGDDNLASIAASATTTPDVKFLTNSAEVMRITNTANVGIGSASPGAKLDVQGNERIFSGNLGIGTSVAPQFLYVAGTGEFQGFKLNQTAAAGNVLTSNSVGVGTWMAPSTFGVNTGTINQVAKYAATGSTVSGSSILFDDATNVGIGTSVPLSLLDVNRLFNVLSGGNVGIGTTTPQDKLIVLSGNVGIGTWTATNSLIVRQGNVGIGTATVPQSLYVAGTAEAQGFKLNQNAVAGYVLTSSSVGVGTWMAAGTLASGQVNAGTINQVAKYAATGPTVSGSSILFDDGTNVGIGTSTPQAQFVVSTGNVGIGTWTASNSLIVRQGNVGIGTATVPQSLYVAGTGEVQSFKMNNSPVSGGVLVSNTVGVGTWMAIGAVAPATPPGGGLNAVEYNSPVGTFAGKEQTFSFNGTNVGIGTTNGVNLLDVRGNTSVTSGNVGIGTTVPAKLLHVVGGNVGISGNTLPSAKGYNRELQVAAVDAAANNAALTLFGRRSNAGDNVAAVSFSDNNGSGTDTEIGSILALRGNNYDDGSLGFYTTASGGSATVKMTIANNGNVGIGTTNPGAQLDLSTDTARKLTTTTWQTGSDARIKTRVQSIDNALDMIRKLRPVKFHYTPKFLAAHPSVKDTDYYNFIAQEYQKVFPDSVTETGGLLYLNSSNMIPYAIAGIKEMDLKVRELEKENKDLKAENIGIKARVDRSEQENTRLKAKLEALEQWRQSQEESK